MDAPAPAASVVVLCRNDHGTLGRVLEGLDRQRTGEPFEVVLVDSSDDGGGAALARAGAWTFPLELVASPVGLSTGAARNAGIQRARGRYLLFLAADCVPRPDWVDRRVSWHREGHPLVAGTVDCAPPRTLAARLQWLSRFSGALPSGRPRRRTLPQYAWSYDRRVLDRPFRDDLRSGEDSDMNAHLLQRGLPLWFDPRIRVGHIGLPSVRAVLDHQRAYGAMVAELVRDPATPWLTEKYGSRPPTRLYPLAKWGRLVARAARSSPAALGWSVVLAPWILAAHAAWRRGYRAAPAARPASLPATEAAR